jgi:hypothetical protein
MTVKAQCHFKYEFPSFILLYFHLFFNAGFNEAMLFPTNCGIAGEILRLNIKWKIDWIIKQSLIVNLL